MLDHWNNSSWVYMSLNCVLNAKAANMNVIFFGFTRLGLNQPHYHTPRGQFTYHHYTTEEPVLTFQKSWSDGWVCIEVNVVHYALLFCINLILFHLYCFVYSDYDFLLSSLLCLQFIWLIHPFKRNLLHIIVLLMYCNVLYSHHVNNKYYLQFIT